MATSLPVAVRRIGTVPRGRGRWGRRAGLLFIAGALVALSAGGPCFSGREDPEVAVQVADEGSGAPEGAPNVSVFERRLHAAAKMAGRVQAASAVGLRSATAAFNNRSEDISWENLQNISRDFHNNTSPTQKALAMGAVAGSTWFVYRNFNGTFLWSQLPPVQAQLETATATTRQALAAGVAAGNSKVQSVVGTARRARVAGEVGVQSAQDAFRRASPDGQLEPVPVKKKGLFRRIAGLFPWATTVLFLGLWVNVEVERGTFQVPAGLRT